MMRLPSESAVTGEQVAFYAEFGQAWLTSLLPANARRYTPYWLDLAVSMVCKIGYGAYTKVRSLIRPLPSLKGVKTRLRAQRFLFQLDALSPEAFVRAYAYFTLCLMRARGWTREQAEAFVIAHPRIALSEDETVLRRCYRYCRELGFLVGHVHIGHEYKGLTVDDAAQVELWLTAGGNGSLLAADQLLCVCASLSDAPDVPPAIVFATGTAKDPRDPRKSPLIVEQWKLLIDLAAKTTRTVLRVVSVSSDGAGVDALKLLRQPAPGQRVYTAAPIPRPAGEPSGWYAPVAVLYYGLPVVSWSDALHVCTNSVRRLDIKNDGTARPVYVGNTHVSFCHIQPFVAKSGKLRLIEAGVQAADLSRGTDGMNYARVERILSPGAARLFREFTQSDEIDATMLVLDWITRGSLACLRAGRLDGPGPIQADRRVILLR